MNKKIYSILIFVLFGNSFLEGMDRKGPDEEDPISQRLLALEQEETAAKRARKKPQKDRYEILRAKVYRLRDSVEQFTERTRRRLVRLQNELLDEARNADEMQRGKFERLSAIVGGILAQRDGEHHRGEGKGDDDYGRHYNLGEGNDE